MDGNGNSWLLHTQKNSGSLPTKVTTLSNKTKLSLEWVVQEQLRKVSLSLTNIETQLEVLSQVLWARDSQELS